MRDADMIEDISKTIERIEKKTRIDLKTLVHIQEAFFKK